MKSLQSSPDAKAQNLIDGYLCKLDAKEHVEWISDLRKQVDYFKKLNFKEGHELVPVVLEYHFDNSEWFKTGPREFHSLGELHDYLSETVGHVSLFLIEPFAHPGPASAISPDTTHVRIYAS